MRHVVVAARSGPNHLLRFGVDEPLDAHGRRTAAALHLSGVGPLWCGPEVACRETATLAGLAAVQTAPELAQLDVGRWRGLRPEEIAGDELRLFFTDPDAVPHGGISVAGYVAALRDWLDRAPQTFTAVVTGSCAQGLRAAASGEPYFAAEVRPASIITVD